MSKRKLAHKDRWVIAALVGSLLLMVKSSEDKFTSSFRAPWLRGAFDRFEDGNQVLFNVAVGLIVSILTYVSTVRIPELEKRARLKRNLVERYRDFKIQCIQTILRRLDESFDSSVAEQLLDKEECDRFFSVPVSESQSRWHQFLNKCTDTDLQDILFEIEVLASETEFTMLLLDIENREAFDLLKRMTFACRHQIGKSAHDYDDMKQLSRFLGELLTGWNIISGARERDKIEQTIESM